MDCPKCNREYIEPDRLPRILTQCGHTICQLCLSSSFSSGSVHCFQCNTVTTTDTVDSLPVNIALMRLKQKDVPVDTCLKHNKQMEAYCESDQELLCVRCILEDGHKRHDITSIQKAAAKQRDTMKNGKLTALLQDQALRKREADLQILESTLKQEYETALRSFRDLFSMLQEVIAARQHELEERLNSILDVEMNKVKIAKDGNAAQTAVVRRFNEEVEGMENDSDFAVLLKVKDRESLLKSSNTKVTSVTPTKPFAGFNKETELNYLWKIVKGRMTPAPAAQKTGKTSVAASSKPDQKKNVPKAKESALTPFEQLVSKSNVEHEPIKSLPKRTKTVPTKPEVGDHTPKPELNLTMESDFDRDLDTSVRHWKGDLSPIGKGRISGFESIDDDALSLKSVDLSSFCRTQQTNILTFGGCADRPIQRVERLDCSTEDWQTVSQTLTSRAQFGCLVADTKVVLVGGKVNGKRVATSEVFELGDNKCSEGELRLAGPRSGFAIAHVNRDIYIVGGSDGVPLKSVDIWNGTEWTPGPSMRIRRDELALVLGPDLQLYALGGYGGPEM